MPMINAVGSSLVAVTAFGMTTAVSYAMSDMVDWPLAVAFVGGGIVGGYSGASMAGLLESRKGTLNVLFALMIVIVATYMAWRNISGS